MSKPVYAFWKGVLNDTEEFCRRISKVRLTVTSWDKQKAILENPSDFDDLDLGFATFFLNRTNRSGILNGGIIGGRDQTGPWKIDARYNAKELIYRIQSIAKLQGRIKLTGLDALKFLKSGVNRWPEKTLVYLDPPYYAKGRDLYHDFYGEKDHASVAEFVLSGLKKQSWIVSYDNVRPIRDLYRECRHVVYSIGYSARSASLGSEVMFFCDGIEVPSLIGPIKITESHPSLFKRFA